MVNKHIPMIKFRKTTAGGMHGQFYTRCCFFNSRICLLPFSFMAGSTVQPVNTTQSVTLEKTAKSKPAVSIIIEDWQLAGKYKRRPISQEEIDFINVNHLYIILKLFL